MAGPRTRCLQERLIVLVTIWPSPKHRLTNGQPLRLATERAVITDSAARSLVYLGCLDPAMMITDQLSLAGQSLSVEAPWTSDTLTPIDVDFTDGVGEVAVLWSSGAGWDAWERREIRISGKVSSWSWGNNRESIRLTIQDSAIVDNGSSHPPGAELTSARFPDIANDTDRGRARNSRGLLPPRCYAPVGSTTRAPMLCVQDEVDASAGVDLTPRRYIVAQRRQTSQTTIPLGTERARVQHPTRDGEFMAAESSIDYGGSIITGYDADGAPYYYMEGDWDEAVGVSTFTTGSASVTLTATTGKVLEGDQVRYTGDNDDDWERIISREGSTTTLATTYGGTGGVGGTLDVIRLPVDKGYPAYRTLSLGGDAGPDGAPICELADVAIDMLRDSRVNVPVAVGDLATLRAKLGGVDVSAVLVDRVRPFDWVVGALLPLVPVRPYRAGGGVRFGWVGPVAEEEIAATLDLDDLGPAHRNEPHSYTGGTPVAAARLAYDYDIHRGAHRGSLQHDATRTREGGPIDSWVATGRAVQAAHEWQGDEGEPAPVAELSTLCVGERLAAGLVTTWAIYTHGIRRQMLKIEIGRSLFYLAPGMHVRITETGATQPAQIWRVERRAVSAIGVGALWLETVPD